MTRPGDPRVLWSEAGSTLLGFGGERHDPGTGTERYERAAETLESSGEEVAFASFTFDPDEEGSVVVIPERLVRTEGRIVTRADGASRVSVISDGLDQWRRGLERIEVALTNGTVEKVVLARRVELEVEPEPDLPAVADRLRQRDQASYTFLVEGLVGCSPELLVSLRDDRLASLVLAGTSSDPGGLGSERMRREHALAAESVREGLSRHVRSLDEGPERSVSFGAIHHLGTSLGGPARPGTEVTRVLADLHPTAAVAGTPRSAALELIRQVEPESRGRYAGPMGWFDKQGNGVFTLALRCGRFDDGRAVLHAGGGIVAGSNPGDELAETELKLGPMLSALAG